MLLKVSQLIWKFVYLLQKFKNITKLGRYVNFKSAIFAFVYSFFFNPRILRTKSTIKSKYYEKQIFIKLFNVVLYPLEYLSFKHSNIKHELNIPILNPDGTRINVVYDRVKNLISTAGEAPNFPNFRVFRTIL